MRGLSTRVVRETGRKAVAPPLSASGSAFRAVAYLHPSGSRSRTFTGWSSAAGPCG